LVKTSFRNFRWPSQLSPKTSLISFDQPGRCLTNDSSSFCVCVLLLQTRGSRNQWQASLMQALAYRRFTFILGGME
jgi:hypothetical protein